MLPRQRQLLRAKARSSGAGSSAMLGGAGGSAAWGGAVRQWLRHGMASGRGRRALAIKVNGSQDIYLDGLFSMLSLARFRENRKLCYC